MDFVGLSRQHRLITSGPRNSLLALVRSSVWQPICTWSGEVPPWSHLGVCTMRWGEEGRWACDPSLPPVCEPCELNLWNYTIPQVAWTEWCVNTARGTKQLHEGGVDMLV